MSVLRRSSGTLASFFAGIALAATAPAQVPQLDLAELLASRATDWTLARVRGQPAVLVIQFPNLQQQGLAFNRAAALIEKTGASRDRVLDDRALKDLIKRSGDNEQTFYQGHGYVTEGLARFFTLAVAQRVVLNAQEQRLLKLLQEARSLSAQPVGYVAQGLQSVVSFTAIQADDPRTPQDEGIDAIRRESVLRHELSHGLFFTDRNYSEHCWRFWRNGLSSDDRQLFRKMLARMHYDASNEALMVNEAQAFLMHTPDTRAFNAAALGVNAVRLAEMRRRFARDLPPSR